MISPVPPSLADRIPWPDEEAPVTTAGRARRWRWSVTAARFTVDLTSVQSDESRRDQQFQGRIMDTATYPTATFELGAPVQLGSVPADGVSVTAKASGNLTLHGTTRPVSFDVTAQRSGGTIRASGQIPVTFADHGIPNPSFGPVTTQDHGQVEFLLALSHA
jgi:polyisoprenoid-binding protein YceI